ncbi:unnamed protein product, partial [Porites evermanni]
MYVILGGRLEKPSPFAQVCLVLNIIINIFTFPFTAVLNALVMIAVKTKRRLRAHKSNIAIALLATTDFVAGSLAQPVFIAWLISILVNYKKILSFLINFLFGVSILHLLLISGERFLAIKHPFSHIYLVKESNLVIASALAGLLSSVVNVYFFLTEKMITFVLGDNSVILTSVACIGYCHFKVYFETRRHKRQIADQQVTQETRKDQRAFKVTPLIIAAILLCCLPMIRYVLFLSVTTMNLLNSLFNPVIYAVRLRTFRVAFIDKITR